MQRTDIHTDQIKELEKLNSEQILFDLKGISHLLEEKAQVKQDCNYSDENNALYLLANTIRTHTTALDTYFKMLGEV